ncbi:hypothetical protein ASPZODRAFT_93739 [Penicilliopsis zonata CBS 506.65]|uniref:Uncharacterized protein n=1 Tax=Penicilliopsis zonata CBS 506.65 TaxID=1073090 RepID=A0A1L9SNF3_9EURO|nr:hypothetical protein ASPZODRAFT_93739 [Penicilliopsis zonata CBS 506.65]OJJ48730.1 hypothetical protein ASPZODRAFT_93739 [Penicilliopsis zonata CBS 506.65]
MAELAVERPGDIYEALVVLPHIPKHDQLGEDSKRRRKCTPSPETNSPSKSVILSPSGALPSERIIVSLQETRFASYANYFPSGEVAIQKRFFLEPRHNHPETLFSYFPTNDNLPCRHIILPFHLRHNNTAFNAENSRILSHLFPDTREVSFDGYFLIFWLDRLPPKPWPITIAGVQPYLTLDPNDEGPTPPIKRPSRSIFRVSPELDGSEANADRVFEVARDFFLDAEIHITEIQYWGGFLVIVLEEKDTNLKKVPSSVAKCRCFYVYEQEMDRQLPARSAAKRVCDSGFGIIDNTKYDVLRPGVILSSVSSENEVSTETEHLTSSGVLVENEMGHKYLTVASHGVAYGENIFHPSSPGTEIGKLILEGPHTDIALAKLHDTTTFLNETFESATDGTDPVSLSGLVPAHEVQIGSTIYMNNPFTGYSEGTCGARSWTRVPSDDPHVPNLHWVKTQWSYLGQGFQEQLEDGVCGSAIWSESGKVLAFFRYAPASGPYKDWCMSIAAGNLIDRGYKLAT